MTRKRPNSIIIGRPAGRRPDDKSKTVCATVIKILRTFEYTTLKRHSNLSTYQELRIRNVNNIVTLFGITRGLQMCTNTYEVQFISLDDADVENVRSVQSDNSPLFEGAMMTDRNFGAFCSASLRKVRRCSPSFSDGL